MSVYPEAQKPSGENSQGNFFVGKEVFVHKLASSVKMFILIAIAILKLGMAFVLFSIMGAIVGFERLCLEPFTMTPNMLGLFVFLVAWEIASLAVNRYQETI